MVPPKKTGSSHLKQLLDLKPNYFRNHLIILQSPWSYRREVWCSPAGDEISNLYFSCIFGTHARAVLFCARALFINLIDDTNDVLMYFAVFSSIICVSVTVLTLWVALPKMFCNRYRIQWSRNQLWNCRHFWHPTDEQLRHVDVFFSNYYNLRSVHFE